MEKAVAKVFKKHGKGNIEILKKYRAKSFTQGEKTTAISGSRLHINQAVSNILLRGDAEERKLVAIAMQETYREDWVEGKCIKY